MTGSLAVATITPPHIEYGQLSPLLLVFGLGVVGVLVEAFVPRDLRRPAHLIITLGGLAVAFVLTIVVAATSSLFAHGGHGHVAAMGAVGVDGPTLFVWGTILVLAFVSVLLIADSSRDDQTFVAQAATTPGSAEERAAQLAGVAHTEIYPLTLFAVAGMLLFPASNDLLTMFVALEVLSLPLYLLCGLARRRRLLSQEASMKYFLLGAFSSAFFLFGVAMLYGYSGSVSLAAIATAAASNVGSLTLLYAGMALLGIGLLFKIGAVPFQSWKPDVYQGAPTPVTALMASCTLVSAFGALLRVFYVAFGQLAWDWRPAMWTVAILTMVIGAIIAITQTDVKRLLAYSSIAHGGFVLTGVIAASMAGLSSSLFYLAVYGFTTIGAFAVVTLVRDQAGEAGHLSGLGRPGTALTARGGGLRVLPAGLRRDPVHQRFYREVRGVPGGHRRRGDPAGHRRRHRQCDRRVLLRPGDRAHVLQRPGPRRARGGDGGGPRAVHRRGRGHRGDRHPGVRRLPAAPAQPGEPCGRPLVRPLTWPGRLGGPGPAGCSGSTKGAYPGRR